jgi:hypothetical protein
MHIGDVIAVSIEMGYGLEDRVEFPAETRDFSLLRSVHIGSGAQPDSYPNDKVGSFPGSKAA